MHIGEAHITPARGGPQGQGELLLSRVFVLDTNKQPLDPVHPGRARILLRQGNAAVLRRYPFTIILKEAVKAPLAQPLRLKIDPGSRTTGIALVNDESGEVVFAAELTHRGSRIKQALAARRVVRRSRRRRKTRHRQSRFLNRRRPAGWLPPSLASRVENVTTWVARLRRLAPVAAISIELVKFDTQKLENPEIRGMEYQRGELAGYEMREYLLEKWGRKCAYCGAQNVPLQVEHIVPRSRGGTDRVSNLALACEGCNQKKGARTAAEFGHPEVQAQARRPLVDAAAVNTTRQALYRRLVATGLPVEVGSGGMTKYNRTRQGLPKTHWLDAACVGANTPAQLGISRVRVLAIKAAGWGHRQMCRTDQFGFPRRHRRRQAVYFGFRTGDQVRAVAPRGKYAGVHTGRVTVRASGWFRVGQADIHHQHCQLLWRADGYNYSMVGPREQPEHTFG